MIQKKCACTALYMYTFVLYMYMYVQSNKASVAYCAT